MKYKFSCFEDIKKFLYMLITIFCNQGLEIFIFHATHKVFPRDKHSWTMYLRSAFVFQTRRWPKEILFFHHNFFSGEDLSNYVQTNGEEATFPLVYLFVGQ
jgi:hypothetical protein